MYRIWLARDGLGRYLSQHDTSAILEQSIRRAALPVAFAGQFNPRMRISYYISLPVGVASAGEPVDITFREKLSNEEIQTRLQKALPSSFKIVDVSCIEKKEKYQLHCVYEMIMSCAILEEKVQSFLSSSECWIIRTHNAKKVNIRPYVLDCKIIENTSSKSILQATFIFDNAGSASVWELMELLGIPQNDQICLEINRTAVKLIPCS